MTQLLTVSQTYKFPLQDVPSPFCFEQDGLYDTSDECPMYRPEQPEGGKPEGGRPEGGRPEGGKPGVVKPEVN